MDTSFCFQNKIQYFNYPIDANIILHINRVSDSIACLFFTDELGNNINIPSNINLFSYDIDNNKKRILISSIENLHYVLCWTEDYVIDLNGKNILNMKCQRVWNIISSN